MIKGIFFIKDNSVGCSNTVEMEFKTDIKAVKHYNIITAKNCFSPTIFPKIHDMVDCVIKYNDSPPVSFIGCIRSINKTNDITIRIAGLFGTDNVNQILSSIACLV